MQATANGEVTRHLTTCIPKVGYVNEVKLNYAEHLQRALQTEQLNCTHKYEKNKQYGNHASHSKW
jgi:hypothetical protein